MNATTVNLRAVSAWWWIPFFAMVHLAYGSTVLTFDDLSPGTDTLIIPNGYGGLSWSNFRCYNGWLRPPTEGYHNGTVSTPNIAFNGFGDPASFSAGSLVDLNSAYLTAAAAFDSLLQVRAQGFSGTNLLYDNTYGVNRNAPSLINFNYLQIDKVLFTATPARQFVLDNLTISSTNPIAIFATQPNSGRLPLTVQFTDQSTGSMTNWDWNFGDGTAPNTAQNPTHTYSADRVYAVTLIATAFGGISSTNTRTISVTPSASFSALPASGTGPLTVQFTDGSTGSITNWDWFFGDGSYSASRNPSHLYTESGTFDVLLIVTDDSGLTDRAHATVTVTPIAKFAGNPASGRVPLTVQFTDQSTGYITNWNWDFGDGSAHSSVQNPSHTYNTNGDILVTLTVTTTNGFTSTDSMDLIVSPAVSCSAPASPPLLPGMVQGWNCNYDGQINTGCITNIVAIAAGANHSLFLKDDQTVVALGGYYESNSVVVPPGLSNVIAVAGGSGYSLVLRSDGTVFSWNKSGPIDLPQGLTNIVAISAGTFHSLALKADGTVLGWGTTVPDGLTNIVAISAGRGLSLALKHDGTVVGWNLPSRAADPSSLSNIVAISAGDNCCYEAWEALRADGTVFSGSAFYTNSASFGPGVVAISASRGSDGHISWALTADGTVFAIPIGYNFCGGQDRSTWVPTDLFNVVAVASGDAHNLALIGDGPPGPFTQKTALLNPMWDNNAFTVSVPTRNGCVYRLEYRESLQDANWIGLPLVAGNGHLQTLRDPTAAHSQRFYRVRRW